MLHADDALSQRYSEKHRGEACAIAQRMPSEPCTSLAWEQWTGQEQARPNPLLGCLDRGRQAQQAGHQGSQGAPLPSLLQGHAPPKHAHYVWEAQLIHPVPLPMRQPCAQEPLCCSILPLASWTCKQHSSIVMRSNRSASWLTDQPGRCGSCCPHSRLLQMEI